MGLCLSLQVVEQENLCELKRQDTYQKKKELDKLRLKEAKMKEKVNTTTVVRKNKPCFSSPTLGTSIYTTLNVMGKGVLKRELILIYLYVILEEYFCHFLIKYYSAIMFSSGIWWEEWSLACFKNKLHSMGQNTVKIIFWKCTQSHPNAYRTIYNISVILLYFT